MTFEKKTELFRENFVQLLLVQLHEGDGYPSCDNVFARTCAVGAVVQTHPLLINSVSDPLWKYKTFKTANFTSLCKYRVS